jgi:hypothetical protein
VYSSGSSEIWLVAGLSVLNIITSRSTPSFSLLFVPCPYSTTIDHNPSSTISTSSFHGTGISIFQHPAGENDGVERDVMIFKTDKPATNQISELPEHDS